MFIISVFPSRQLLTKNSFFKYAALPWKRIISSMSNALCMILINHLLSMSGYQKYQCLQSLKHEEKSNAILDFKFFEILQSIYQLLYSLNFIFYINTITWFLIEAAMKSGWVFRISLFLMILISDRCRDSVDLWRFNPFGDLLWPQLDWLLDQL